MDFRCWCPKNALEKRQVNACNAETYGGQPTATLFTTTVFTTTTVSLTSTVTDVAVTTTTTTTTAPTPTITDFSSFPSSLSGLIVSCCSDHHHPSTNHHIHQNKAYTPGHGVYYKDHHNYCAHEAKESYSCLSHLGLAVSTFWRSFGWISLAL